MQVTAERAAAGPGAAPVETDEPSGTLVIGIGNSLFGDDGAGIHVVERLLEQPLPEDVEVIDGGTLSFTLLERVESAAYLVIVDAAQLDAEPGAVRVFHDEQMDDFLNGKTRPSVHEVNIMDVLVAARLRGRYPPRCTLVGIQPLSLDWSNEPTPAVAEGVERAAVLIRGFIGGAS